MAARPGRAIPVDNLDAIFERFQQVDASESRETGGTGLGLAICRCQRLFGPPPDGAIGSGFR